MRRSFNAVSAVTDTNAKINGGRAGVRFIRKEVREFHVGDLAVYPAHGVGRIEAIENKIVNGEKHDFYIIKVLENGMVIMIPTWNVDSVGLRDVISEGEVPKIYDFMKSKKETPIDTQTWNRRYRDYMDKIKTGSLYDVAEVFRDLYLLKLTKDLSFGERKLFDTAQTLLVKELSTARNTSEDKIFSEIESLFISKENPKD
ncbi:CarD family transcriptional regulator [Desulfobacterium sp. N47]|uniref:CarD family transcriptional regulator n=1 Tax=Desulfobacterium sp. N47 TaxID=3115210 RepID=UPI003CC42B4C